MWTALGCKNGNTFMPVIYEEGSEDMDCHILDQWSVAHILWGFILGSVTTAPRSVAAWKIGLLFVLWELWENVIEVAFSTYAPGQYEGDSLINSIFDMIPSMSGVYLGRHHFHLWPLLLLVEAGATRMGFGIHSVYLGHQGSICDVRVDPVGCSQSYAIRLVAGPLIYRGLDTLVWRAITARWGKGKKA